jgi:nitrate reductase NapE component
VQTSRLAVRDQIFVFLLCLAALILLHERLLHLPYFWDEVGYYVPAAHDLLISGSLIPYSTPSNAHPPLVMTYLALCWKIFGFSPLVTRCAMLVVAAFTLLGLFRLARRVANTEVAIAVTVCTALYPVFFVQSSLAQVDLAAAGLTFWGLLAYTEQRRVAMVVWFSLAVLAKETAILTPCALFVWEMLRPALRRMRRLKIDEAAEPSVTDRMLLLAPIIPLAAWYSFHYFRTGVVFGNVEFFRYNVQSTMHPLRIFLALLMRTWQVVGYLNLWLLVIAALLAMWRPALRDGNEERQRISFNTQFAFLAVVVAYVLAMAFVGGAVLARYMLPAVPLVMIVLVSTLWRRVRWWKSVVAVVALAFVAGLFINPPYGFSLEDNLAYRDYILLHQQAEQFIQARYPKATVLTAWPANDEMTRPYLGYVARPVRVVRIDDFTAEQLMSAADLRSNDPRGEFDVALVFSTKYDPPHPLLDQWRWWREVKTRYFDYHRDLPPGPAAGILGGEVVLGERRNGQWIGVIELPHIHIEDARLR